MDAHDAHGRPMETHGSQRVACGSFAVRPWVYRGLPLTSVEFQRPPIAVHRSDAGFHGSLMGCHRPSWDSRGLATTGLLWAPMGAHVSPANFHGPLVGSNGRPWVSRELSMGVHGWVSRGLPWTSMGLLWALTAAQGPPVGSHGCPWVSLGFPVRFIDFSWGPCTPNHGPRGTSMGLH